ncbi:MAG: hypothetical protein NDJ18_04250 [candidate division Zixibacteria bacterium]|nr:hypothetical protein [candidate division Zixibacteria bacterium]
MRTLLLLSMLVVVVAAIGCNSGNSIVGPQPHHSGLTSVLTPTPPDIAGTIAVYGSISNLTAAGLTITTADGRSYDITFSAGTMVRYKDGVVDVGTSELSDGMMVTVVGVPVGLPSQAKVRASLIIINSGVVNQEIMSVS